MKAMKKYTVREWQEEGRRLFGPDIRDWRFRCVKCGEVQCARDFEAAGMGQQLWQGRVYFSCIGRYTEGRGCDWTLGGLFAIHTAMVDGTPVFEFATAEVEA